MQKNEKKRFSFEKDDRSPSQLREGRFEKPSVLHWTETIMSVNQYRLKAAALPLLHKNKGVKPPNVQSYAV